MLMVGYIGVASLAAVGLSMQFMMVVNVIITLFVVGSNALVSRFVGEKRTLRASALGYSLSILLIISSFIVTIVCYLFAVDFYNWMGASSDVVLEGGKYFKIVSLAMVFIFLDTYFYSLLSASGDASSPLKIKLFSALLNAFLNYIFIFGHFGFSAYGIEGAAMATVISYIVATFGYILIFKQSSSKIKYVPIFRMEDIRRAMRVGWSGALDRAISSASFLIFVSIIATYGTFELAGYQVGLRVEGIAFMPGFGFAIAASALVGQSLGAKDMHKAFKLGVISSRVAYIFMGSVGLIMILFAEFLVSFFTQDEFTIAIASYYLIFVGLAQIPLAIMFVYSAALRGAGATKTTLKINLISLWVFRVIPSFLAYKFGFSIVAIFIIMNIETLIKAIIYIYIYNKKVWLYTKI